MKDQDAAFVRQSVQEHTTLVPSLVFTCLGTLELPWDSCHDVYSICSSNPDANGTQPTAVGCVGVCANQHHSWVGIVLQDDLFDAQNATVSVLL